MVKRQLQAIALGLALSGAVNAQDWNSIGSAEKSVLAPLSGQWGALPKEERTHLLEAAKHYPKMSPAEQDKFRARLPEWGKLDPAARKAARENYDKIKNLSPEQQKKVMEKLRSQER